MTVTDSLHSMCDRKRALNSSTLQYVVGNEHNGSETSNAYVQRCTCFNFNLINNVFVS